MSEVKEKQCSNCGIFTEFYCADSFGYSCIACALKAAAIKSKEEGSGKRGIVPKEEVRTYESGPYKGFFYR